MKKRIFNPYPGRGIYTLVLELKEDREINTGALGKKVFQAAFYSYTGSARGSGGFRRIGRHLNVAAGSNPARHWHIDYLLPHTTIKCIVLTYTEQNLECPISETVGQLTETVQGFGSSDCRCPGHLHTDGNFDHIITAVIDAHQQVTGKIPIIIPKN